MILEDFYEEVLRKVGVLAAEESPHAADTLEVSKKYEQIHAEYSRRDLVNWFDDEDVPDWISDGFASVVAYRLTTTFSVSLQKAAQLKLNSDEAVTLLVGDGQRRNPPQGQVEYE